MLKFIASTFFSVLMLCTCVNPNHVEQKIIFQRAESKSVKPTTKLVIGDVDKEDVVLYGDSTAAYYHHMVDEISKIETGDMLYLRDENGGSRLFCMSLMGRFSVSKVSSTGFYFVGTSYYPQDGNWNVPFEKYEAFSFNLNIADSGWNLSEINFPAFLPPPVPKQLLSIKARIDADPRCISKDWEVSSDCFSLLERYEFLLFSAVLNNDLQKLAEYLKFRSTYSIMNAGAFSEYYTGNVLYLIGSEVVRPEDLREAGVYERFSYLQRVYGAW